MLNNIELNADDLALLHPTELARLLADGFTVGYNGKTLYPFINDLGPFVITGSDAYGSDFGAGDLRDPQGIKDSILHETINESMGGGHF